MIVRATTTRGRTKARTRAERARISDRPTPVSVVPAHGLILGTAVSMIVLASGCRSRAAPEPLTPPTKPPAQAVDSTVTQADVTSSLRANSRPEREDSTTSTPRVLVEPTPDPSHDEHYDRTSPAGATLQRATEALHGFPVDRIGQIDWVAALRRGLIDPRAERERKGDMPRYESDIIMKRTREMPWVRFRHDTHVEWLACSNCHDRIFRASRGSNDIDMTSIFRGRDCGVCHDRIAFSVHVCERCHSVDHDGSPPRRGSR